jgi:hypothetical protein
MKSSITSSTGAPPGRHHVASPNNVVVEAPQFKLFNAKVVVGAPPLIGYGKKSMKPQAVKINSHQSNPPRYSLAEDSMDFEGGFGGPDGTQMGTEFDESEIFNDMLEGGGVDPSVRNDDTLRDSIKDSMVSSEAGDNVAIIRDTFVMNRMNWIMHLKILFDELESFTQA